MVSSVFVVDDGVRGVGVESKGDDGGWRDVDAGGKIGTVSGRPREAAMPA